jgi:hypothetical protein
MGIVLEEVYKKSGAKPLLALWLHVVCSRVNFTLTLHVQYWSHNQVSIRMYKCVQPEEVIRINACGIPCNVICACKRLNIGSGFSYFLFL